MSSSCNGSYPPVLVPPIKSKYLNGGGVSSRWSMSRMHSMSFCKMSNVDMPRIPPPSGIVQLTASPSIHTEPT
jgi:hypothetical protein